MVNRIVLFSVAGMALAAAALPRAASAADYYDEGRGSVESAPPDGAGFGQPRHFAPRGPGPVVFDERGRGFDRPAPDYDGSGVRRGPALAEDAYDGGPMRGPHFGPPPFVAAPYRVVPVYRPVAVAGDIDDGDRPNAGCEIQQTESVTPAGWRKIVTHRTCYRR
jgi:hypothetical protein